MLNRIRIRLDRYRNRQHSLHLERILEREATVPLIQSDAAIAENAPQLAAILQAHTDREAESFQRENQWTAGSYQQRDRLSAVVDWCAAQYAGDILEIGCLHGLTTVRLAEVAARHNRRVVAVDPWQPGTQNIHGGEYEAFLKNTEPYRDIIDVIRLSSLDAEAIRQMKARELCFAYVDGLHTYEACLSDILAVAHTHGFIGVDDLSWSQDCVVATRRGAAMIGRKAVHHPLCREGYLLPLS